MKRFQSRLSQTSWNLLLRSCIASLAVIISLTMAAGAAPSQEKPDFTGHWVMNQTKSDYGFAPRPDDETEDIQQNETLIVVRRIVTRDGVKVEANLRYTTDGTENTRVVERHQLRCKSHWEGESLVTVVRDETGGGYTETRSLSKDGKTQTIEMVFVNGDTGKLVFDRR
jgi:hypothetical protein